MLDDNRSELEHPVWPPPPEQSTPPQISDKRSVLDGLSDKPGLTHLAAFTAGLLINIVLPFALLVVAAEIQNRFFRTYVILGRHEVNRETFRLVMFCIWGSAVTLDIVLACLWRRSTSYTRAFLVWALIFSSLTFYWIWPMPPQIR